MLAVCYAYAISVCSSNIFMLFEITTIEISIYKNWWLDSVFIGRCTYHILYRYNLGTATSKKYGPNLVLYLSDAHLYMNLLTCHINLGFFGKIETTLWSLFPRYYNSKLVVVDIY